jgi:hypothetical protein
VPYRDPERKRERAREWMREKRAANPAFVELERVVARERMREKRAADPAFVERQRASTARWALSPIGQVKRELWNVRARIARKESQLGELLSA